VAEAMSEERLAELTHRANEVCDCGDSDCEGDTQLVLTSKEASELLAEIDRLNTALDANRVVRNAAESSSRIYKGVVDRLKAQRTELRAENAGLREHLNTIGPRSDEYGIRTVYVSTLISEEPVADNLSDALRLMAAAEAKGRADVVSREVIRREVGQWRGVGGEHG
jgi:hypothetical protein